MNLFTLLEKKAKFLETRKKSTWELCEQNNALKELLDINFTPTDFIYLQKHQKKTLITLLLCNNHSQLDLPKEILFKIFTFAIMTEWAIEP